jgi:hypothetical protein
MNRRKFFGMTVAALTAAGLPLTLLAEKSIFLPPSCGWYPSDLRMREVIQYSVIDDKLFIQHDALFREHGGRLINLEQIQVVHHLPCDEDNERALWAQNSVTSIRHFASDSSDEATLVKFNPDELDRMRRMSRLRLEQFSNLDGLTTVRGVRLPLPRGAFARYV